MAPFLSMTQDEIVEGDRTDDGEVKQVVMVCMELKRHAFM